MKSINLSIAKILDIEVKTNNEYLYRTITNLDFSTIAIVTQSRGDSAIELVLVKTRLRSGRTS